MRGGGFALIPLDYKTPDPRSQPKTIAVLARFGGGLAIGSLVDLTLSSYFGKQDFEVCDILGMLLWVILCAGLLRLGLAVRRRMHGKRLCERHGWLTVITGVVMAAANLLIISFLGRFFGENSVPWDFAFLPGLMAGSAWLVFRLQVEFE